MRTLYRSMSPVRTSQRAALAFFILAVVLLCLVPVSALAQVPVSECGAERGLFSVVPAQGPAGSAFSVSGSVGLLVTFESGEDPVPATTQSGPVFEVWWVETGMGDAIMLGTMPSTYDAETMMVSFSGSFMVPAASAPGQHQVALLIEGTQVPVCEDFNVTTTVQEDAYVQTVTTLPATGSAYFTPVAGLIALVSGALVLRRRRRIGA